MTVITNDKEMNHARHSPLCPARYPLGAPPEEDQQ